MLIREQLKLAIWQAVQEAGLAGGNFLENIECIVNNTTPENFEEFGSFALPVGKFSKASANALGLEQGLVYLKPRIYAKIRGWWNDVVGHPELGHFFYYFLPLAINSPTRILADKQRKDTFLIVSEDEKAWLVVVELVKKESRLEIKTMFLIDDKRVDKEYETVWQAKSKKDALLGGLADPSVLAPATILQGKFGRVAGARFPSLQESFGVNYSRLFAKSQVERLTPILTYGEGSQLALQDIELEHPANPEHGDYSSNIAMVLKSQNSKLKTQSHNSKVKTKNPRELAGIIVKNLPKVDYLEKIEVAGPGFVSEPRRGKKVLAEGGVFISEPRRGKKVPAEGGVFINFWLSKDYLIAFASEIASQKDLAGTFPGISSSFGVSKKIIIEFGQPNTHKLPHVGHFRSYSIGESLARILEAVGHEVFRANYQGDIGLHVAKCLWGYRKKVQNSKFKVQNAKLEERIGFLQEAYQYGSKKYAEDEIAKKEIDQLNVKIYQKDERIVGLWQETRQWSLDYYAALNRRLGITYHREYFESEAAEAGKKIVLDNLGTVFKESAGAIIFPGEKYGLHNRVFITAAGNPTYEAKDLALIFLKRKDFAYDVSLIATAVDQVEYFKVVYAAAREIAPELAQRFVHLPFGYVTLKGGKMSSREGTIVSIDELLGTVEKAAADLSDDDKVDDVVVVGAAKYSLLKQTPVKNIVFDVEESIDLEGNSGPYLQYTFARTRSVLGKGKKVNGKRQVSKGKPHPTGVKDIGLSGEEADILRALYRFPEIIEDAGKTYSPNLICNFLFDLAQKYNKFYQRHRIIGAPEGKDVENLRLMLTAAVGNVIKNGLYLLGIEAPERM